MSIDARINAVIYYRDGTGLLELIDRPGGAGQGPGCAGQRALAFDEAPNEVGALVGLDVWGGACSLMLGDREVGRRSGYTKIRWNSPEEITLAVHDYLLNRYRQNSIPREGVRITAVHSRG